MPRAITTISSKFIFYIVGLFYSLSLYYLGPTDKSLVVLIIMLFGYVEQAKRMQLLLFFDYIEKAALFELFYDKITHKRKSHLNATSVSQLCDTCLTRVIHLSHSCDTDVAHV